MLPIDKNIPIPEAVLRSRRIYPWYEMQKGDSFFVPNKTPAQFSASVSWANKSARKFLHAQEKEGVRVWRIE